MNRIISVPVILATMASALDRFSAEPSLAKLEVSPEQSFDIFEPFTKAFASGNPEKLSKVKMTAEQFLRVEHQREVYEDVVQNGCFYCSAGLAEPLYDQDEHSCVDVCSVDSIT